MIILTTPNELLKQHCRPVTILNFNVVAEMFALLDLHKGLGLAAPQVGILERFFIASWGEVFINPVFHPIHTAGQVKGIEGCLSIPGEQFQVTRWKSIVVGGRRYDDLAAVVIQHELDHLDGILISEKGEPVNA